MTASSSSGSTGTAPPSGTKMSRSCSHESQNACPKSSRAGRCPSGDSPIASHSCASERLDHVDERLRAGRELVEQLCVRHVSERRDLRVGGRRRVEALEERRRCAFSARAAPSANTQYWSTVTRWLTTPFTSHSVQRVGVCHCASGSARSSSSEAAPVRAARARAAHGDVGNRCGDRFVVLAQADAWTFGPPARSFVTAGRYCDRARRVFDRRGTATRPRATSTPLRTAAGRDARGRPAPTTGRRHPRPARSTGRCTRIRSPCRRGSKTVYVNPRRASKSARCAFQVAGGCPLRSSAPASRPSGNPGVERM